MVMLSLEENACKIGVRFFFVLPRPTQDVHVLELILKLSVSKPTNMLNCLKWKL